MAYQTVLVVDDEPHIVEVVKDYLKQSGYRVLTAGDGETALQQARQEHPDLVILDLMMPGGMGGLDVCRQIRQDQALADIPIIMLTARTEEMDRVIGLEIGADDLEGALQIFAIETGVVAPHYGFRGVGVRHEAPFLGGAPVAAGLADSRLEARSSYPS